MINTATAQFDQVIVGATAGCLLAARRTAAIVPNIPADLQKPSIHQVAVYPTL